MPLSAKQMEYLAVAWQCFDSEPKIDYNKFATIAGLKTAASARELMRVTKNKLKEEYGARSSGLQPSNEPKTPAKKAMATTATPTSRKRARNAGTPEVVEGDGDGEDDDDEEEEEEEEEEEMPAVKKAKSATPIGKGRSKSVEVKSEPSLEDGRSEDEVAFF